MASTTPSTRWTPTPSLRLTEPYAGATNGSRPYTIFRQFGTLATWEDCVDAGGTACGAFPAQPSNSLVADGRSEVGIAYEDAALAGGLLINGSITDSLHTITLTADDGNRHYGRSGQGVLDQQRCRGARDTRPGRLRHPGMDGDHGREWRRRRRNRSQLARGRLPGGSPKQPYPDRNRNRDRRDRRR